MFSERSFCISVPTLLPHKWGYKSDDATLPGFHLQAVCTRRVVFEEEETSAVDLESSSSIISFNIVCYISSRDKKEISFLIECMTYRLTDFFTSKKNLLYVSRLKFYSCLRMVISYK